MQKVTSMLYKKNFRKTNNHLLQIELNSKHSVVNELDLRKVSVLQELGISLTHHMQELAYSGFLQLKKQSMKSSKDKRVQGLNFRKFSARETLQKKNIIPPTTV